MTDKNIVIPESEREAVSSNLVPIEKAKEEKSCINITKSLSY